MKKGLLIGVLAGLALAAQAQEMHILEYAKVKKGPFNMNHIVIDKEQAILDLKTSENGFTFLANGKTEIAAEEGEGILTLKAPDKTAYIVVKHADYGQLTWKVPAKKGLRKKKHYTATLATLSPDKEYKLQKQWVIFHIQPKDVILTVDSTMAMIHDGRQQLYLPLGEHTYLAETPFHKKEEGKFELTDEAHKIVDLTLQPIYSYITVRTPLKGCDILIDGQLIGNTQATSGHLREGSHHLTVFKDSLKYYDADISIGWSEKKTIDLASENLKPMDIEEGGKSKAEGGNSQKEKGDKGKKKEKKAAAAAKRASIFGDRKEMAYAPVAYETPGDTAAFMPGNGKDYYGMINVHSNEIGADVYVDGKLQGTTPCIVKELKAGKNCKIRLAKAGFQDTETVIKVEGNDLTFVKLDMKRKKRKENSE